ncbi:hypothetical protein BaRGS_00010827 [Batillaria attramentaria]|uniref:Secreted protein n=1 Tax=Batillaria attramentaria TaxID=370345 RepID=A0ABD0LFI2_9CAEN
MLMYFVCCATLLWFMCVGVCEILSKMCAARKETLQSHAAQRLPGRMYHAPSEDATAAGILLDSATNDTVESGFGLLCR